MPAAAAAAAAAADHAYHGGSVFSIFSGSGAVQWQLPSDSLSAASLVDISGWMLQSEQAPGGIAADTAAYQVIASELTGLAIPACLDVLDVPYRALCARDPDGWTFYHKADAGGGYHGTVAVDHGDADAVVDTLGTPDLDARTTRLHMINGRPAVDVAAAQEAREVFLASPPEWPPAAAGTLLPPKTYAFTRGVFRGPVPGFMYDYTVVYTAAASPGQLLPPRSMFQLASPSPSTAPATAAAAWTSSTVIAAPVAVDAAEDLVLVPLLSHSWNGVANESSAAWLRSFCQAHDISGSLAIFDGAPESYTPLIPLPLRKADHPNKMQVQVTEYTTRSLLDGGDQGPRTRIITVTAAAATAVAAAAQQQQQNRDTVQEQQLSVGLAILRMIESSAMVDPLTGAEQRQAFERTVNQALGRRLLDAFSDTVARSFLVSQLIQGQVADFPGIDTDASVTFADDVLRLQFSGVVYVYMNADVRVRSDDDRDIEFRFPVRFNVTYDNTTQHN